MPSSSSTALQPPPTDSDRSLSIAPSPASAAPRARLQLSATQLIASALAAVTATVAASYLGVSGTVVGAAVASVLTVAGNAVYSHSIRSTSDRVRTVVPAAASRRPATVDRAPAASATDGPTRGDRRARGTATGAWRRVGFAAAAMFVTLLTLLTAVELVSGRPLADLLHGKPAAGTTIFGSSTSGASRGSSVAPTAPQVTVTQTVAPKVVTQTPTVTRTAPAVTVTPTPSGSAATAPATPTPAPTAGSTPSTPAG